ncbi:MAG: hypothetical protein L0211_00505 [Planctomycetaceae bacterium]|nr:hypothetical protein [Planctomycetaceae bacterium]
MIRCVLILELLLAALSLVAQPVNSAEPVTSWELSPYRIHLLIAVEPGGSLPRSLAADLVADLPARATTVVGGSWRLEAAEAPLELRHALVTALADVTAARLPAEFVKGDKVIVLALSSSESGVRIQARELDVITGLWNSIVTRDVAQPEQIPGAAMRALLAAFAPLARIDAVENGTATLRLKGGAIVRARHAVPLVTSGAAFRPVLVPLDAQGKLQAGSAQPIDWTYLTATTSGDALATCRIDSGLAGEPIPAYHPRRARLAVGVSPAASATRLKLVTSGASPMPLEGYEVVASAADSSGAASVQSLGISDLEGVVSVPPGSTTVRIVQVRQGTQTLARLPIVPGLAAQVQLALPDDRQRLAIDNVLMEAEDALIDLAARRQALAARIKLAKKSGDAGAERLTPKLRALASVQEPAALLDQAEQAIKGADARTQALLQPKLAALQKLAQDLAGQSPSALLDEPKPAQASPAEAKKP